MHPATSLYFKLIKPTGREAPAQLGRGEAKVVKSCVPFSWSWGISCQELLGRNSRAVLGRKKKKKTLCLLWEQKFVGRVMDELREQDFPPQEKPSVWISQNS